MNEVMLFVVVWNSKGQHMSSFAFPYENSSAAIDAFNTHKRSKLHSDPTYNVQGTLSFPDGEVIKLDGEGRERQSLKYFSFNPDKCFINPWTGRFTKITISFKQTKRQGENTMTFKVGDNVLVRSSGMKAKIVYAYEMSDYVSIQFDSGNVIDISVENLSPVKRYLLVGGKYWGKGQTTGLKVVGHADTYEEAKTLTDANYDNCGGVLLWIDTETGLPGEPGTKEQRETIQF